MSASENEVVELVGRLFDRLAGTTLGVVLRIGGLSRQTTIDYVEKHDDVKQALGLWLGDVREVIRRGERTD